MDEYEYEPMSNLDVGDRIEIVDGTTVKNATITEKGGGMTLVVTGTSYRSEQLRIIDNDRRVICSDPREIRDLFPNAIFPEDKYMI